MDPINEQCFAFVLCILCYMIIRRLGTRQMRLWARDWLCRPPQSSANATLLQELDRNEYKNILCWFLRISRQMSMCICLHLPVLILSAFSCSFKILAGNSYYTTHISRIMDPINEQCFAFVICILCCMIIRRLGTRQMRLWTRDWLCRPPQSSANATLLQELDRNEYKNILCWFFRISRQMSMCICLHLPVLILSVDSDWLNSIKVGQSLTGNRNYFYLRQSWSNFDQVCQSGVYTIKVSKSKSVKVWLGQT